MIKRDRIEIIGIITGMMTIINQGARLSQLGEALNLRMRLLISIQKILRGLFK